MHLRSVPSMTTPPTSSVRGVNGAVATADQLATNAGIGVLAGGGNAVDAAIAANAVMGVVAPHLCGMGGDLFVLIHRDGAVAALNATGRAGSGADADELRAAGHDRDAVPQRHPQRHRARMCRWLDRAACPLRHAARSPTCWRPRSDSPSLDSRRVRCSSAALRRVDDEATVLRTSLAGAATTGARLARSGLAAAMRSIVSDGRAGFYEGPFGEGLLGLGGGLYSADDLARSQADWVEPLSTTAFGVELHTIPPNSQGYLTLGGAMLADSIGIPDDPDDPHWAHLLIECATAAGFDRPDGAARDGRRWCIAHGDRRSRRSSSTTKPRRPVVTRRPPATPRICAPSTATAWACR